MQIQTGQSAGRAECLQTGPFTAWVCRGWRVAQRSKACHSRRRQPAGSSPAPHKRYRSINTGNVRSCKVHGPEGCAVARPFWLRRSPSLTADSHSSAYRGAGSERSRNGDARTGEFAAGEWAGGSAGRSSRAPGWILSCSVFKSVSWVWLRLSAAFVFCLVEESSVEGRMGVCMATEGSAWFSLCNLPCLRHTNRPAITDNEACAYLLCGTPLFCVCCMVHACGARRHLRAVALHCAGLEALPGRRAAHLPRRRRAVTRYRLPRGAAPPERRRAQAVRPGQAEGGADAGGQRLPAGA